MHPLTSLATTPSHKQHQPAQPGSPQPSPIRRFSKIARLPAEKREAVNLMLRDGVPYDDIVKNLSQQGYSLNKSNVSRWHAGGFQDWLDRQAYLDEIHGGLDFASRVLNTKNADLLDQAGVRVALTRMNSILLRFDPAVLNSKLADNPASYTRLLNTLCKLTETAVHLQARRERRSSNSHSPQTVPPPDLSALPTPPKVAASCSPLQPVAASRA